MAATVLIVENDADLRFVFRVLFQRARYEVTTASDGAAGLTMAVRRAPDLVIINLSNEEGPDLCRALRADARTADVPLILMTAALYPDAAAAARAGADTFMTKPLDNHDLLAHAHALVADWRGSVGSRGLGCFAVE